MLLEIGDQLIKEHTIECALIMLVVMIIIAIIITINKIKVMMNLSKNGYNDLMTGPARFKHALFTLYFLLHSASGRVSQRATNRAIQRFDR